MPHVTDFSSLSRDEAVFFSRLAEAAERYDDMLEFTRLFMKTEPPTSYSRDSETGERSLISVAFQNNMSTLRRARRIVLSTPRSVSDSRTQAYVKRLEASIVTLAEEASNAVEEWLLPRATTDESRVFYLKLEADHHRYLAELLEASPGRRESPHAQAAQTLYTKAADLASSSLLATDPLRLGLLLNYSVFQYDILADPRGAWSTAKDAFDGALEELDTLSEEGYKNAVVVLKLLRDNLQTWLPEVQELIPQEA